MLRICLSSLFNQYTVTITQVQESVSDFNPESESEFGDFKARSRSPTKNEDSASLMSNDSTH